MQHSMSSRRSVTHPKVELELVRALRGDDGLTPLLAAAEFGSGTSTKVCPAHRHEHLVAVAHFARSKRFAGASAIAEIFGEFYLLGWLATGYL